MIGIAMTVLGLIPGLATMITAVTAAWFNTKVAITTAQIGGDVAVATATIKAAAITDATRVKGLQIIGASWILSFLVVGFALPWIVYEWRVVVYDNVWMVGATSTPAIKGDVASWATVIISCLFGSGTVMTAAHLYFNKDK